MLGISHLNSGLDLIELSSLVGSLVTVLCLASCVVHDLGRDIVLGGQVEFFVALSWVPTSTRLTP